MPGAPPTEPSALPRAEILAPAGTEESFQAALASRADAVYLGLSEGFNARRRSTAFSLASLPELVARAHFAGAKLYLTLNTLVFESELEILENLLRAVVHAGVDALIVQDPATAFLARRLAPELRLHASTQMTISSAEAAAFAQTLGIVRVVLPRELSLAEIARFTKESPLEAEVFVHGALCMAWSGQCLTSEAFSDRSANRGQCSQACRMPYEAIVDGERKDLGDVRYLLSPQDLAAQEVLPELLEAGVRSLKIEGRYKGAAYVTSAVDSYRNFRDALTRGEEEEGRVQLEVDRRRAQLSYTRGASLGFLRGDNHQELVVGTTPKHRGIALGVVRNVRGKKVLIEATPDFEVASLVRPGLGVSFEPVGRSDREHDPENVPGGPIFEVRALGGREWELGFGTPGPDLRGVRPGDEVRLTGDPGVARDAERRMEQPISGRLPAVLRVSGRLGEPLVALSEVETPRGTLRASIASSSVLAASQKGEGLGVDLLTDKLGAFGGTPFFLERLDATELGASLYLPVAELKALRRQLVAALLAELDKPRYPSAPEASVLAELKGDLGCDVEEDLRAPQLVPLFRTEEQLRAFIDSSPAPGTEVELDWMEMVGLSRAVRSAREAGLLVTLATVRVQKPGEEAFDRRIAGLAPEGVLVRHFGALMHFSRARDSSGEPRLSVHGDFSLNVTNSLTARHLLGLGLETVTASHDLNKAQLLDLLAYVPRGRVAVVLHHHIPTFHNSHCVYAHLLSKGKDYRDCGRPCEEHRMALRDYAGHEHPMVVDVSCRNTMFNATAQSAAPLVPRLLEHGVRRFRVEFVWEKGEEVTRTLDAYGRLLRAALSADEALRIAAVPERYGVTTLRAKRT
jgi:putative protease